LNFFEKILKSAHFLKKVLKIFIGKIRLNVVKIKGQTQDIVLAKKVKKFLKKIEKKC